MLSGRVYAIGVLLLVVVWGGTVWRAYGHGREVERLRGTATAAKDDAWRARGDLEAYRAEVVRLNKASIEIEARLDQLRDAKPKVIERYNRVVEMHPLPVDCRPGPERLRELNAAIEAANVTLASQHKALPVAGASDD